MLQEATPVEFADNNLSQEATPIEFADNNLSKETTPVELADAEAYKQQERRLRSQERINKIKKT